MRDWVFSELERSVAAAHVIDSKQEREFLRGETFFLRNKSLTLLIKSLRAIASILTRPLGSSSSEARERASVTGDVPGT